MLGGTRVGREQIQNVEKQKKGRPGGATPLNVVAAISARIEFDDQIRFHLDGIRHFVKRRDADERNLCGAVSRDVIGNVAFRQALSLNDERHFNGLAAQTDFVANVHPPRRNIALYAIDQHMAVADKLTGSKHGWCELRTINDGGKAPFKKADQILRCIALHPVSSLVALLELLFRNVAVISLELLLGLELKAIVGNLAFAALTVLAGSIFAAVNGRLGATPDVFAQTAVELVLGAMAL